MKLYGPDFYNISELLTDEELMIQKTAYDFVQTEFMPLVEEHYEKGTFPVELATKLGELGFMGSSLPIESGGSGVSNVAYGLILHELERGDSGLRSFASVQGSLVMYPIHAYGSDEQKDKWLSGLGDGTKIGCFGLTEPNFGSNPGGMATRCKKDGDDWIINGNKMWITNGSLADVAVVWARDEEGIVRGFLLEKGMEGFTSSDIHGKLSLRCSITSELSMSDVRVPDSSRLPNIEGLKGPLGWLTQARYGIAWGAVGAAMDCYDTALRYSKERVQFGRPIGGFQLQQKKLAEMITEITKAQLLAWRLGVLKNEGKASSAQISMAKRNNVEMAIKVAREARQILGGMGITGEYSIMRHMMNLESVITYEGTHDIHLLITGLDITGLNAFK